MLKKYAHQKYQTNFLKLCLGSDLTEVVKRRRKCIKSHEKMLEKI